MRITLVTFLLLALQGLALAGTAVKDWLRVGNTIVAPVTVYLDVNTTYVGLVDVSAAGNLLAADFNSGFGAYELRDAAADSATKGLASFLSTDFDDSTGLISLDYTNAQAASGSVKGFLTSADWTTFNSKQAGDSDLTDFAGLTAAQGDLIFGNGAGDWAKLAIGGSSGSILTRNSTVPIWTTATYPGTVVSGNILFASGTNVVDQSTGLTYSGTDPDKVLTVTGSGSGNDTIVISGGNLDISNSGNIQMGNTTIVDFAKDAYFTRLSLNNDSSFGASASRLNFGTTAQGGSGDSTVLKEYIDTDQSESFEYHLAHFMGNTTAAWVTQWTWSPVKARGTYEESLYIKGHVQFGRASVTHALYEVRAFYTRNTGVTAWTQRDHTITTIYETTAADDVRFTISSADILLETNQNAGTSYHMVAELKITRSINGLS